MMIRRAILVVTCWSVVLTSPLKPYSSQEEKTCPDDLDKDLSDGFDFLRTAGVDSPGSVLTGVTKVTGSNKNATAFSIDPETSLRMPTRLMFPKGVPDEFSFAAVLRLRGPSTFNYLKLIRISDSDGHKFGIAIIGLWKEVEFYVPDINFGNQVIIFSDSPHITKLFDGQWHKLEFSSTRDSLELYIDCQLVASELLDERDIIDIDGEIFIKDSIDPDGEIFIAAMEVETSATIDLQMVMMHCDPMKPKNGRCDDIDGIRTTQDTKSTITTKRTTLKPTTNERPTTTTENKPEEFTPEPIQREPELPVPRRPLRKPEPIVFRRPLDDIDEYYGYDDVYDTAAKGDAEPFGPRRHPWIESLLRLPHKLLRERL